MPRDPRTLLHDMLDSCRFVRQIYSGHSLADFKHDRVLRSAIERELQIVGEALIALSKISPEMANQITDAKRIVRFRHVLVHGYAVVDPEITWVIVDEKLPVLIHEVETLLAIPLNSD